MTKKLEGNGLWESSRMMLPEHKEAIIEQNKRTRHVVKPLLDEQLIEDTAQSLAEAMESGREVILTVYEQQGPDYIRGFINQVDSIGGRIKVTHELGKTWVPFADILQVQFS